MTEFVHHSDYDTGDMAILWDYSLLKWKYLKVKRVLNITPSEFIFSFTAWVRFDNKQHFLKKVKSVDIYFARYNHSFK